MKLYITIAPGGHEVSVIAHLDRLAAKDALDLTDGQLEEAERESDYYDPDGGGSIHVQEVRVGDVLTALLPDEESWFNAVIEIVEMRRLANTHEAFVQLLKGSTAIGVAEGFPLHLIRSLADGQIRSIYKEVTSA